MNQPIAIQSWCLRAFKPLAELFEQLKSLNVSATELCGVHANFKAPETFADVAAQFRHADVQIVAIGVERMTGDLSLDRPRFEFCRAVGAKNMSITFAPSLMFDGIKQLEMLADEYDLNLGIHNHGGYDWLGNDTIMRHVLAHTGQRIGIHLDTAWVLATHQDPIKWVDEFANRLHGIHIKDFIFDKSAAPTDVIIGNGNLDLPRLIEKLNHINFTGPLVIEYEGDEKNPGPALKQCVQILKNLV